MKNLSTKWQKLIVWLTGYLNVIAFFIAGGYTYLNTEDEDVKDSAKNVLLLLAGFAGIELVRSLIYNTMSVFGADYSALSVVSTIGTAIAVIKTIAFAVLFALDMNGIKLRSVTPATKPAEKSDSETEN